MVGSKLLLISGFSRQCFNLALNQNRLTLCPLLLQYKESHPLSSPNGNQTGKKLSTQTSEKPLMRSEKLLLLNESERQTLEDYKLEYEAFLSRGRNVPRVMTDEMLLDLLNYKTKSARIKVLKYWRIKEVRKESKKVIAARKSEERDELYEKEILKKIDFSERIFGKFEDNLMNFTRDLNTTNGMLLNHPFVFDSSFEEALSPNQCKMFLKQLMHTFNHNKNLTDPYHIFICNAKRDGQLARTLTEWTHKDLNLFSVTYTDKSYLDLFPRKRLLYLSPYSKEQYIHYNPNDIFVVGINDDLHEMNKGTLLRAKMDKIRHAKLPVDFYLKWIQGKKAFPLNHIFSLLNIVAETRGDWEMAFRSVVPQRKFKS